LRIYHQESQTYCTFLSLQEQNYQQPIYQEADQTAFGPQGFSKCRYEPLSVAS
jgi:hypothetical protein